MDGKTMDEREWMKENGWKDKWMKDEWMKDKWMTDNGYHGILLCGS